MSSKKSNLADKINSLITAAPENFGSDDETEDTRAKIVERYEESESDEGLTSSIRRQNIDLLDEVDERYKGKKVSRKDLYGEESSDEEEAEESEASEGSSDDKNAEESSEGDTVEGSEPEEDENEDEEESNDEEDAEVDEDNPLRRNRDPSINFKNLNTRNLHRDIDKGQAVREQLKLWEHLLEMRIQFQKCLVTSNQLPQFDSYKKFTPDKEFVKNKDETTSKLTNLLEGLLQVQEKLFRNNSETKSLLSKKRGEEKEEENPMDEEIASDTDEEVEASEREKREDNEEDVEQPLKKKRRTLKEYESVLHERHENVRSFRNSVIQKWNDKTKLAAGNATKGTSQSVVKQIEFLLNDKSKLIKRTQLKRSEYKVAGKESTEDTDEDGRRTQEHDTEIYDDDDFYHQLLRELIEQKSADITDPIQLSKQWIQLQNMRSKMKRKIDTRATKGRRIRYNVHTKLVNFMAPITVNDTWTDLAKNELYNSLFGRIKAVEGTRSESAQDS